ncbi:hypothetical protein FHS42_003101 [Streptomyces zagrosensis]|uniref:Uncharacterized protein n=1 Tax=Streptomyces zagrosensis TaxID=1042984 RepID=A0A7W9UYT9_9ACTN|nr:hypothetical protein [Streptomyces zagrosensis]
MSLAQQRTPVRHVLLQGEAGIWPVPRYAPGSTASGGLWRACTAALS